MAAPASRAGRRHRLVRRETFGQRITAFLNPLDNLLSASLIFETYDWEGLGESIATPAGVGINLLLMVTRANSDTEAGWLGHRDPLDDIFESTERRSWFSRTGFSYLMSILSYLMLAFAIFNAIYCLNRTKPYRMFEASIHSTPPTPSARKVRVASTPNEFSPIRVVKNILSAVPGGSTPPIVDGVTEDEVWEIAMWDPPKFNMKMLCFFSPIHALVIFLALPYTPPSSTGGVFDQPSSNYSTSRMSVIFNLTVTLVLLSVQTSVISFAFQTQNKDQKYINSQVFSEYNKKFVAPRTNIQTRDVATSTDNRGFAEAYVSHYSPSFKTYANPAYVKHTVPESAATGLFANYMRGSTTPTEEKPATNGVQNRGVGTSFGYQNMNGGTPRQSLGGLGTGLVPASIGRSSSRKSNAAGDSLVTPAKSRVISSGRPSASPAGRPGRNGNVWGGGVDYGVQSPMRKPSTRDRGI